MKNADTLANSLGYVLMDGEDFDSDTVGVALVEYFERHHDCPEDGEVDGDTGWNVWALDKAKDVLRRMADEACFFLTGA